MAGIFPALPNPARIEEISVEIPPKPPIEISETTPSESFITPLTFGGLTLLGLLGMGGLCLAKKSPSMAKKSPSMAKKSPSKPPMTIEKFLREELIYDQSIKNLLSLRDEFSEKYKDPKPEDVKEVIKFLDDYAKQLIPIKVFHSEASVITDDKGFYKTDAWKIYKELDRFVKNESLKISDNLIQKLVKNDDFMTTFYKEYSGFQDGFQNMLMSKPKERKEALTKLQLKEYLFNAKYSALEGSTIDGIKRYQNTFKDFRKTGEGIEIASKAMTHLYGETKIDINSIQAYPIAKWLAYITFRPSVSREMFIEEAKLAKEKFHEFDLGTLTDFMKDLDVCYNLQAKEINYQQEFFLQKIAEIKQTITGLSIMSKEDIGKTWHAVDPFIQLNNGSEMTFRRENDDTVFIRKSEKFEENNGKIKKIITTDCFKSYKNEFHNLLKNEFSREEKLDALNNAKKKFFEGLEEYWIETQKIRLLKFQIDCFYKNSDPDFYRELNNISKEIDNFLDSSYTIENVKLKIPSYLLTYPLNTDPFIKSCRSYFKELKSRKEKIEPQFFFEIVMKFALLMLNNFELKKLTAFSNLKKLIEYLCKSDFSILDESVDDLFPFQKITSNPQKAASNEESDVNDDQGQTSGGLINDNPILNNPSFGELVKKD